MKERWLNLILFLTNRIYTKKQIVLNGEGWKVGKEVLLLVLLEILLAMVSIPLYIGVKPVGLTAYFIDTEKFARITADYNLRRILTLTGVSVILIIWGIKLLLIIAVPRVYGPLQLYDVVNMRPTDVLESELVATETGLQTARIVSTMPIPTLTKVTKVSGGDYTFSGMAAPQYLVAMLLSGVQTAVYSVSTNPNGTWEIKHQQSNFHLSDGNHSILLFSYDQKAGTRGKSAPEQYFKVTASIWESIINGIDTIANYSLVIILVLGVFLTVLTL